jgi:hypothetical protein
MPNEYLVEGQVVYIKLKGKAAKILHDDSIYAVVDLQHLNKVIQGDWYLGKTGYAFTYQISNLVGRLQLHDYIYVGCLQNPKPPNHCVDHINHDRLDNRSTNLRLATFQENSWNRSINSTNKKNKYKGVKKISATNYSASLTHNGVKHEIKNIKTEIEAAETYNILAKEFFGEFAALNKICPNL